MPGFATHLDILALAANSQPGVPAGVRSERIKDILATTIVGLYEGLSDWYLRTGEGRVATIKAVIGAEQATRDVSSTIIFDSGRHIPWRKGSSIPGYQGVAGLFSELLGDDRFTVMAVLSNEMYLGYDPTDPVNLRIADYIRSELMETEVAQAIFNLFISSLDLSEETITPLRTLFDARLRDFTAAGAGRGPAAAAQQGHPYL